MKKRNRKIKKQTRGAKTCFRIVLLMGLGFLAGMGYWLQDSRCTALEQEIYEAEKKYTRLERDCQREISSWDELKTPDKLRLAFIRHGLDMDKPNQEQVIHMSAVTGKPEPNQMSVTRIRQRRSSDVVAELPKTLSRTSASGRIPRQLPRVRH